MAYLDFAGSTAETIAHLRENGRITLMWCAFQGPPNIVRVHGRGEPVFRDDPRFPGLLAHFPGIDPTPHGLRAVIVVTAELIRDSCGYAVPFMSYEEDRPCTPTVSGARTTRASAGTSRRSRTSPRASTDCRALPLPLPVMPAPAAG